MATTTYAYSPISNDSIRLLHLAPRSSTSPTTISGSLTSHELLSAPPFIALSYEWGPPEDDPPVLYLDSGTVALRSNAAAALLALRDQHNVNTLWIDMVCINQQDIPERTDQVKLMDKIYLQADEVLVWLGKEDDLSEFAFDSAIKISSYAGLPAGRQTVDFDEEKILKGVSLAREEKNEESTKMPGVEGRFSSLGITDHKPDDSFPSFIERESFHHSQGVVCPKQTTFLANYEVLPSGDEVKNMARLLDSLDVPWTQSFVTRRLEHDLLRDPTKLPPPAAPVEFDQSQLPYMARLVLDLLDLSAPMDLVWHALCSLFGRGWFYRVWMLQEVVLARYPTVIVGRLAMSWDAFMYTDTFLWKMGLFSSRNNRASHQAIQMDIRRDTFWGKNRDPEDEELDPTDMFTPLGSLLSMLRESDCSEPRDKVFAALGMAGPWDVAALPVDYRMPLEELYAAVARHEISTSGKLDALQFVNPDKSPGMPSWAADLRQRQIGSDMFQLTEANGIDASRGRPISTNVADKSDPLRLHLRGCYVGKVGHTGTKLQLIPSENQINRLKRPVTNMRSQVRILSSALMVMDGWRTLCAAHSSDPYPEFGSPKNDASDIYDDTDYPAPEGRSLMMAFWRTLCADMFLGGGGFTPLHAKEAVQSIMRRQQDDPFASQLPALSLLDMQWILYASLDFSRGRADWYGSQSFWSYAGAMSAHKRFFVMENGLIGTGPTGVKPGDEVWVLEGGAMPFLLRSDGNGTANGYDGVGNGKSVAHGDSRDAKARRLVGPAYVHGIMRGEAWGVDDAGIEDVVLI